MPSQMGIISNSRRRRNQVAELNARQGQLPQMIANKNRAEDLERAEADKNTQISQFNRQYSLQKKQAKARKKAQMIGMGLEAAKLGTSIYSSGLGKKTMGSSGWSPGKAAGGGLVGAGIGTAIGGKTGGLIGAGLGLAGGGFGSAISGGFKKLFGL